MPRYYGPADVRIEVDNAAGELVDVSKAMISLGDANVQATMVDNLQGFGEAWARRLTNGIRSLQALAIEVWLSTEDPDTRAIFKEVPTTPRTPSKTMRVTYGDPENISDAETTASADAAVGDQQVTLTAVTGVGTTFDADEHINISDHAYRIAAVNTTSKVVTLNRGLIKAVASAGKVTKLTELFKEFEGFYENSGTSIDRSTLNMIKGSFMPTGQLIEQ